LVGAPDGGLDGILGYCRVAVSSEGIHRTECAADADG
jgi:hypothetical protein